MRVPRVRFKVMIAAAVAVAGLLALPQLNFALPQLYWGGADHYRFDDGEEVVVVLSDALYVAGYIEGQGQQITIRPGTRAVVVHDDWDDSKPSRPGSRPVEVRLLEGKDKGARVHVTRHELRGRRGLVRWTWRVEN